MEVQQGLHLIHSTDDKSCVSADPGLQTSPLAVGGLLENEAANCSGALHQPS